NLAFLRPRIEAETAALLGQKVEINNDIKFRLVGGRPALLLHHVSVGADVTADAVDLALRGFHPSRAVFVRAYGLALDGKKLGNFDFPVTVLPDGFSVSPLRGSLKGAALTGHVKYAGGVLSADGAVQGIPLSLLLGDAPEGEIAAQFALQSKGKTAEELLRGLDGRLLLTNNGGTLTSASLKFWSSGLLSSLLPGKTDKTPLNCAIVDFNIENGIAESRTIVVDTRDNTIFARGRIDLADGKIDMVLTPHPKDVQLLSLATPVRVAGPLENPVVTPEAGGVATKIGSMLLGVVNPAFALLPLMKTGFDDYKGSCATIAREHVKDK
ncbi:MAG: AsmA family protein, partial [Alphaproteobacteria bacterium]|nr:AsmA family protein [Alphaproteobacteria bacterium]